MAYSSVHTLIPLDNVARLLQIDPLHFNGITSSLRPARNACDDIWSQHDWQATGRASRETLAMALKQAEDEIVELLGYSPMPTWFIEEEHQTTRPSSPELFSIDSINIRGQAKSVRAKYGYVIEGGQRATSVIQLGAAVVYSDVDGDGYKELATVTVPTTITDIEEICVFYPGKSGTEEWEIRPVTISVGAGVATITFSKHQVLLENLIESLGDPQLGNDLKAVDGDNDANFLASVDVYRVYNNPAQQLIFYSENGCLSCNGSGCAVCGATAETGCLYTRDERMGILAYRRADWDSVNSRFTSGTFAAGIEPDKVKIWYRAGWRNMKLAMPKRMMDLSWERLITFYALTLLDTDIGWCDNTKRIYSYQIEDMHVVKQGKSFTLSDRALNNPLGTTRAAVNLWLKIVGPNGRLVHAR